MRVRKSAIAGVLFLLIAVLAVPVAAAEEYVFVAKWGSYGTGDGQFDQPWGVAVDSADNVYVAELINDRIQKFDSSGNFLTMWGSSGTNDGQFQRPQAVAVDTAGNVYVTDDGNSRVQKFDDSGRFITAWGSKGSDDGNFSWPAGIAVNAVGNIYVADAGNNRIQKFTGSTFLSKWGSYGTGDEQFDRPWGVAVDSADNVYVVDNWNHRIQKFDADGTFLTTLGSLGANEGQFLYPQGVTVDRAGNVYVADTSNYRIQKFDADGTFLTMWGSSGYSDGQFWSPWSVAVDSAGNVYVADRGNNRIQKFAPIPIPTITGIAPNSSTNTGPVSITDLSGTGFIDGATVKLTRAGEPEIVATNVSVVSSTQITCTLDLTGAAAGPWNVVVTNPDERYDILSDGFAVVAASEVVTFNDPNLEAAVRQALGKPEGDITADDMARLSSLTAVYRGIGDLSGLEYAVNLKSLDLHSNQITDISPLAGLTNLQSLDLYYNQISDISPLAGLTNLQSLDLHNTRISDIGPLAGLTNLQSLRLYKNRINDISPLAGLTNLQSLHLSNNQISDLGPLAGLTNLQTLDLPYNQINDIGPLAGLINLQSLRLHSNQINDISPLAGLTNLQSLTLYYNQISDLGPLAGLTNLQTLALFNNQINDIGPLAGLTNLQTLDLYNNQISDIGPLVANSGLGSGDSVNLHFNYLDLTPGSSDMNDIQTLQGRGVHVIYTPQYQMTTYTLDLTVNPDGSGTVTGAGTYAAGATVSITATPNEGWVFINWTDATGTPVSSEPDFNYIMPAQNTALIANFEPAPPVLTRIDVSPAEATLDVGATRQFTATGYDQYGNSIPTGEIVWSSTNTLVGTIDATGLFTATAEGSTTVTATAGEVSGTAEVIVTPALTVTGITPDSGPNTGPVSITDLSGTGFVDGATVKLTRTGEPDIIATDVSVVSPTQITCTLDLTGAAVGPWNVMVTNPSNQSATLTDGFTVNAGNRAPIAEDDTYTTDEDTLLTVAAPGVLENDGDPDGDTLTAGLVASTTNGTLALNPDGSFAYTPNPGWSGNDTFTYAANDSLLASNTATVTITVNPMNKPPTAQDDAYDVNEGETLTVAAPGVLENDNDPEGDALAAVLVGESSHGSVTLNTDGSFTYTPDNGFSGTDTFTYRASDGSLDSEVATAMITVNPVNEAPTASDDTYATDEAVTLSVAAPGVLGNDDDPDGDTLSAVLVEGVSSGTLTLNADGSFVYTPNANFAGTDTFTYRASDGELESNTATVTITVNPINEPPAAVDDTYATDEAVTLSVVAPGVLANDNDPDGDDLTAVLESSVSHGSLTLNEDGSFTYTPNAGWSGTDSFVYKAFDGELYSDAATVTITVTEAANNPPEVTAVTTPTDPQLPGSLIQVTGRFTDPDADDTHTATWNWGDGATSEGTVDGTTGTITGSHTYTAPGTYTITLTVTDSEGASDTGTTSITVQTPAEATTDLISQVESLSLPSGIENGLTSKLDNAIEKLNKGNEHTAVNQLNAFINQVKAQREKKIPAEEADSLIAMVQRIIESI